MKLVSYPDLLDAHKYLTIGRTYEVLKTVGINCVLIESDVPDFHLIILATRLE